MQYIFGSIHLNCTEDDFAFFIQNRFQNLRAYYKIPRWRHLEKCTTRRNQTNQHSVRKVRERSSLLNCLMLLRTITLRYMNVDIERVSSGWGKRLFCLDCYYGLFDAFHWNHVPLSPEQQINTKPSTKCTQTRSEQHDSIKNTSFRRWKIIKLRHFRDN